MEKIGYIEIDINSISKNTALTPNSYDINEIKQMMENAERMLFPESKKERPTISYEIKEGSVKQIFRTGMQAVIALNAILGTINECKNIDFLESPSARAFESMQITARKKGYSFSIITSLDASNNLVIDPSTDYVLKDYSWTDAEFYFYGKIIDAGGKEKANIHLLTEDYGLLKINTAQAYLAEMKENILYKTFGIRAKGKQKYGTSEIDKSSLEFIALLDYDTKYEKQYLAELREKAGTWINTIDPEKWLREIRGYE
jgi:hypothetical protein